VTDPGEAAIRRSLSELCGCLEAAQEPLGRLLAALAAARTAEPGPALRAHLSDAAASTRGALEALGGLPAGHVPARTTGRRHGA
jgi:hypothetical protein